MGTISLDDACQVGLTPHAQMILKRCGNDLRQRDRVGLTAEKADRPVHAMQSRDLGGEVEWLVVSLGVVPAVPGMTHMELARHMTERRHGFQPMAHFGYREIHHAPTTRALADAPTTVHRQAALLAGTGPAPAR